MPSRSLASGGGDNRHIRKDQTIGASEEWCVNVVTASRARSSLRYAQVLMLVPLIAALVPLLITPGALAYFDITPKIALILLGTALMLSQVRANSYNLGALLSARAGKWLAGLLAAQWLVVA